MFTDDHGLAIFSSNDLMNMIYQNNMDKFFDILCDNDQDIEKFNKFSSEKLNLYSKLDISIGQLDEMLQNTFLIPNEYLELNVQEHLLNLTNTDQERERVLYEYSKYENKGLIDVLKCAIYLVDVMRKNKIIWGVGRGSSVSSFILFLIGIHRVNPIKYGLDFTEFMNDTL